MSFAYIDHFIQIGILRIFAVFLRRSNRGLLLQEPQLLLNLQTIQLREGTKPLLLALQQFHPQLVLKIYTFEFRTSDSVILRFVYQKKKYTKQHEKKC